MAVYPTHEIERELQSVMPEWIEREPQRWQQVQYALRQAAASGPVFATFEEFVAWVDEDVSAEWDNGGVIFMSPSSTQHQKLVVFLLKLLGFFVENRDLGVILTAPYKMKLAGYGPEPDIIFVAAEHAARIQESFLDGPADLVVEVVSPESVDRDRGRKFVAYEAAGIPEYWLIDPQREVADFYQLDGDGRYRLMGVGGDGRYHSAVLPGLWIEPAGLWGEKLPAVLPLLRELGLV